jgi:hypothetical protein
MAVKYKFKIGGRAAGQGKVSTIFSNPLLERIKELSESYPKPPAFEGTAVDNNRPHTLEALKGIVNLSRATSGGERLDICKKYIKNLNMSFYMAEQKNAYKIILRFLNWFKKKKNTKNFRNQLINKLKSKGLFKDVKGSLINTNYLQSIDCEKKEIVPTIVLTNERPTILFDNLRSESFWWSYYTETPKAHSSDAIDVFKYSVSI